MPLRGRVAAHVAAYGPLQVFRAQSSIPSDRKVMRYDPLGRGANGLASALGTRVQHSGGGRTRASRCVGSVSDCHVVN